LKVKNAKFALRDSPLIKKSWVFWKFLGNFWKGFGSLLEVFEGFGPCDAQKKEKLFIFDAHF